MKKDSKDEHVPPMEKPTTTYDNRQLFGFDPVDHLSVSFQETVVVPPLLCANSHLSQLRRVDLSVRWEKVWWLLDCLRCCAEPALSVLEDDSVGLSRD